MTQGDVPATGKHILLVDDDRLGLVMTAKGLGNAGYRVNMSESAEDAESWLAGGERPDLAIIDMRMPGQGGLYLAQRLRELDHVPFMVLSAYGEPAFVEQAIQSGALGYAVKPVDLPQLLPAIEAALARANELQALRETRRQLQTALDNERDISVATGILMVEHRLPRHQAFALLRDTARKTRRKLPDVAGELVAARNALGLGTTNATPSP